ncbi:MAG: hypothetical protein ABW005_12140 [Burkholderiaceae bacterium]
MNASILKNIRPARAGLLALSATLLTALSAQAALANTDAAGRAARVDYISGGVGSDEALRMQQQAPQWPASFEFAVRDGQRADFAADVRVTVRDAQGQVLLRQVKAEGPFMLARLQPGRYEVAASLAGRTLTKSLDVRPGTPSKTLFLWPAAVP